MGNNDERNDDEEETELSVLSLFCDEEAANATLQVTHIEVHSSVLYQMWYRRNKFIVVWKVSTTFLTTKTHTYKPIHPLVHIPCFIKLYVFYSSHSQKGKNPYT